MSVRQFENSFSSKNASNTRIHGGIINVGKQESAIRCSAANVTKKHCLHVHEAFETESLREGHLSTFNFKE